VIISTVIVSSALIACCVLLLHVAFSNSRSILLVPWLVGDMLMRSIHTIILISGFIMAFTANVSHGVSTVFIMSCFIGNTQEIVKEISLAIMYIFRLLLS
jgi:hypothetical protein